MPLVSKEGYDCFLMVNSRPHERERLGPQFGLLLQAGELATTIFDRNSRIDGKINDQRFLGYAIEQLSANGCPLCDAEHPPKFHAFAKRTYKKDRGDNEEEYEGRGARCLG